MPDMPVTPTPAEPAKTDVTSSDALENARKRAAAEAARRGRVSLKIPLAGSDGGSGISIAK